MCLCVCVCYIEQLVLQGFVLHVVVDQTHSSWSFTEAQQIYDVWMSEPGEGDHSFKTHGLVAFI